ncbi:MAG TPA: primosomal protein N' [Candidatus Eremiobacteraceae bacterium]|nr:primosomal protein N' [Candidatus Eremiobacteraceae bacterium]
MILRGSVEVVLDVQNARFADTFTYAAPPDGVARGAHVRVPLGRREISGWVVGPSGPGAPSDPKQIGSVDEETPLLDESAIDIAIWLRRRYACTLRESLLTVQPRITAASARTKYVVCSTQTVLDGLDGELARAVGEKPFTLVGAVRALKRNGRRYSLAEVRKNVGRLTRAGAIRPLISAQREQRTPRDRWKSVLLDARCARGSVQARIARVLAEAGGSMPASELRLRAGADSSALRRAERSGVLRLEVAEPDLAALSERGARAEKSTPAQAEAIESLDSLARGGFSVALLHGVTGSGKTHVYARLIDKVRKRGGRAIVLVPEIALTPQTSGRIAAAFGARVGVLHSGLAQGERDRIWQAASAGAFDLIVGPRSAVFAPLPDLRLIVVDEEHEPSYKQDVAPRYDAQTVARRRMEQANGLLILGSATPSLESYAAAMAGSINYVRLSERATRAPLPPVQIVDMSAETQERKRRPLGPTMIAAMHATLGRGEKALLFVNRRGYAGLLLCRACGFAPRCKRCAVSLVVHSDDRSLRCHVCGAAFKIPETCPKCHAHELRPFGFGTQRVEEEVRSFFPTAGIVRMDADTTSTRGAHGRLLEHFGGSGDVLIGTQMIAKGLDFPTVTLVGVVSADVDLHRPDFRAAERTFQLLTQVAGRAGRAAPGSAVVVQTYAPDHYAIRHAASHDYESFAATELAMRRELSYPPFGRIAYIGISATLQPAVERAAAAMAALLQTFAPNVAILGPAPDPMPKARGEYRLRIALKTQDEDALLDAAEAARAARLSDDVRVTVTVDPR